jgi:thiol-disulfide isomerase/thioredoxin
MKKFDLKILNIEIHTSHWCPDCVREVPKVQSFIKSVGIDSKNIEYFNYDDKEKYKLAKAKNELQISCIPTISIKIRETEILKFEEIIEGDIHELVVSAIELSNSL